MNLAIGFVLILINLILNWTGLLLDLADVKFLEEKEYTLLNLWSIMSNVWGQEMCFQLMTTESAINFVLKEKRD